MNVTDDVVNDLLTLYLAGEASADTRALIEERARREPAFAAKMTAARAVDQAAAEAIALPGVLATPPDDVELRALTRTRQAIFLRMLFFAAAVFFTLLPLSFRGGANGVEFLFLGKQPGVVWAFWGVAAASWTACVLMHREVRKAGL
jgi:anti-sigma factor RsiW